MRLKSSHDAKPSPSSIIQDRTEQTTIWCINHSMVCVGLYICLCPCSFWRFPASISGRAGFFHLAMRDFKAENVAFLRDVRHLGPFLVRVIAIVCVAVSAHQAAGAGPSAADATASAGVPAVDADPWAGVLVNLILKDNWAARGPAMSRSSVGICRTSRSGKSRTIATATVLSCPGKVGCHVAGGSSYLAGARNLRKGALVFLSRSA